MRFTVTWTEPAKQKLAGVWLVTEDRTAITDAADEIECRLRIGGDWVGEEFLDYRFFAVGPIAVLFRCRLEDRIVEVFDVLRATEEES